MCLEKVTQKLLLKGIRHAQKLAELELNSALVPDIKMKVEENMSKCLSSIHLQEYFKKYILDSIIEKIKHVKNERPGYDLNEVIQTLLERPNLITKEFLTEILKYHMFIPISGIFSSLINLAA